MRKSDILLLFLLVLTLVSAPTKAENAGAPASPTIHLVSVSGSTNEVQTAAFDCLPLQKIGKHQIQISTIWRDAGPHDFEEVLIRDVQRVVGASQTTSVTGPFWIIDPRDEFSKLQDERHDQRWAWQVKLNRLEFK
jgi:hypothetical protein